MRYLLQRCVEDQAVSQRLQTVSQRPQAMDQVFSGEAQAEWVQPVLPPALPHTRAGHHIAKTWQINLLQFKENWLQEYF